MILKDNMNTSIEKTLEKNFVSFIENICINGYYGKAIKGPSYMYTGIPDRIAILPGGGGTVWVEFKGGTYYGLTPKQVEWKQRLINSDPSRYFCIDTKEQLEELKNYCLTLIKSKNNDTIKPESDGGLKDE